MWYDDPGRVEFLWLDAGVFGFVGKADRGTVRVGRAKIEKERPRIIFTDEFLGVLGHADGVPAAGDDAVVGIALESVQLLGLHVHLADRTRPVTRLFEEQGQRFDE